MENIQSLGQQIKNTRLSKNLSMESVAKKAGITRMTLFALEKGDTHISLNNFLSVLKVLDMEVYITDSKGKASRVRASRLNTKKERVINRFIIMCIEEYASYVNQNSKDVYKHMQEKGVIKELTDDYEDLHGMSTVSINEYIDSLI